MCQPFLLKLKQLTRRVPSTPLFRKRSRLRILTRLSGTDASTCLTCSAYGSRLNLTASSLTSDMPCVGGSAGISTAVHCWSDNAQFLQLYHGSGVGRLPTPD